MIHAALETRNVSLKKNAAAITFTVNCFNGIIECDLGITTSNTSTGKPRFTIE